MESLRIFERFEFGKIDESWIESVWDSEFLIFDNLNDEYLLFVQSDDIGHLLRDTSNIIKNWILENENLDSEKNEVSWQTLRGLGVNHHAILPVLGYLMNIGQNKETDEEFRQICLRATSLYLTLLAVPGSSVYGIFNENLFLKILDTLSFSTYLLPQVRKSKSELEIADLYSNEVETTNFSHNEKATLTKGLNAVIYDLILLLKSPSWSFQERERSLELTVCSLVQVTRLGNDRHSSSTGSLASLTQNAYAALQEICHDRHGSTEIAVQLIAKSIMQHLTINYRHESAKLSGIVRETSVEFLGTLLTNFGAKAETGILVLIQRLLVNCPERLEARQKQAIVIVKLMNIARANPSFRMKIIDNLILFSHQNKISHRVFAQEIIRRYLFDNPTTIEVPGRIDEELKIKKILLTVVLTRCTDVSSFVRGRALATVKEYTDQPLKNSVQELFSQMNAHQLPPDLESLRKSLNEDTNVLPGKDFLISILKLRAQDERALVRRSAIQILENAVIINPDILESAIIIASKHCRDPAMTVRRVSIHVLTSLVEHFPDFPGFHRVWVKSVVPQVFDTEVNVQDKAIEVLGSLIISGNEDDSNLSWKIINELSLLKMRKHLTRACEAWIKSGTLTDDFILKVQSKIGSEHNEAVWILLSSISGVKELPQMEKYFSDFQEILRGKNLVDFLSLEVLRSSCSNLSEDFVRKIETEFYKYLCEFSVHPCIISITLDILCSALELHNSRNIVTRQEDFQVMMENLILRSEVIMKKMIDDEMPDDMDLYLKAISTLGHSSFLCSTKISMPTLRILQGILIENGPMSDVIHNRKDVQAATVVVLGQQAMRDQSIAHEMLPIFRQLLCTPSENTAAKFDAAVRVNAAKALVDVCTRFTSLVEPFLPDMCVTMKDSETTVREAIVVLFIELLVEDFIKVRGSFFFHILTMLIDEDETIREMTIFLVKERLLMKKKNLIDTEFFKAIFHYNGVELGKSFCERKMTKNEIEILTLPGNKNEEKRRKIYDFLLNNLDAGGKLKLLDRFSGIFDEIISRGILNLKRHKNQCLLKDIVWVVSRDWSQESGSNRFDSAEDEDEIVTNNSGHIGEKIKQHGMMVLLPNLFKLRQRISGSSEELDAVIGRAFIKIGESFSKDQLTTIYNEFPELEKEMERNSRLYGKKQNQLEEEFMPIGESTPLKSAPHTLINVQRFPKIVLRRLSSLTSPENNEPISNAIETRDRITDMPTPIVVLTDCLADLNTFNTPRSSKSSKKFLRTHKKRHI